MNCYIHEQKPAIGTCVHCGRFICEECKTEINGKIHCKKCVSEVFSDNQRKLEQAESNKQAPMVFMNAGGGSSSSSSSSAAAVSGVRGGVPKYPVNSIFIHIILLLFTGGLGNIVYFLYINNKQKQWRMRYS